MCWRAPTPAFIRSAGDRARDAQQRMQQTAAPLYARFARFGFMRLQQMLNVRRLTFTFAYATGRLFRSWLSRDCGPRRVATKTRPL